MYDFSWFDRHCIATLRAHEFRGAVGIYLRGRPWICRPESYLHRCTEICEIFWNLNLNSLSNDLSSPFHYPHGPLFFSLARFCSFRFHLTPLHSMDFWSFKSTFFHSFARNQGAFSLLLHVITVHVLHVTFRARF